MNIFRRGLAFFSDLFWGKPVPLAMDRHEKGGTYLNYGQSVYEGTHRVADYDEVMLVVRSGKYVAVDYERPGALVATVQAKPTTPIRPGDLIVIYQGADERFWIRALDEYNRKFTEVETYS